MARLYRIPQMLNIFIYSCVFLCCFTKLASANIEIDEDNWQQILEGEWMVEFYAPWCPACNALAPAWRELSSISKSRSLEMRAAAVDVTKSPGLSGRFVVTALPTIYHVKDGVFRQYKGPRDANSMVDFVERARWKKTDAVPSWKAPDSYQMGLVAQFFKLSQALRGVHNTLMESYGLPTWGSYLFFAVATIFLGALLGLLLVCFIDTLYPPRRPDKVLVTRSEADRRLEVDGKKDDVDQIKNKLKQIRQLTSAISQELINDDIVDDAENVPDSDAEKNSPSDTSEDDKKSGAGDEQREGQEVRKRRPRKAD